MKDKRGNRGGRQEKTEGDVRGKRVETNALMRRRRKPSVAA